MLTSCGRARLVIGSGGFVGGASILWLQSPDRSCAHSDVKISRWLLLYPGYLGFTFAQWEEVETPRPSIYYTHIYIYSVCAEKCFPPNRNCFLQFFVLCESTRADADCFMFATEGGVGIVNTFAYSGIICTPSIDRIAGCSM